jgi:NAD(P)-dependent dehydrogenase (short-subunit alcohol dehydrogenase family)
MKQSKTILVTGGSDGIGRQTAEVLAGRGHKLWIIGRNPAKTEAAAKKIGAKFLIADLLRPNEVKRVCKDFMQQESGLDVLINNAGGMFAKRELTPDGFERTFALNHLAYFVMVRELLPLLRQSEQGRIVNVASEAHRGAKLDITNLQSEKSFSAWRAYQGSKLANILFTRELSKRLRGSNLTVNCLHPGFVASRFGHDNGGLWKRAIQLSQRFFAISEEEGAKTSVFLADDPSVANTSGEYFDRCRIRVPSAAASSDQNATELWRRTEELLNRSF